jgi:hypothetical protein
MAGATEKVHHEMSTNVEFDRCIYILDVPQKLHGGGNRIQRDLKAILNIICSHARQNSGTVRIFSSSPSYLRGHLSNLYTNADERPRPSDAAVTNLYAAMLENQKHLLALQMLCPCRENATPYRLLSPANVDLRALVRV